MRSSWFAVETEMLMKLTMMDVLDVEIVMDALDVDIKKDVQVLGTSFSF